jgi:hypothetical protein
MIVKSLKVMTLRKAYEHLLTQLKQLANDPIANIEKMSNHDLVEAINYYLKYFGCQPFTVLEKVKIEIKLNEEKNDQPIVK